MKLLSHLFRFTTGATLTPGRALRTAVATFLALLLVSAVGHTAFGSAFGLGVLLGVLFTSFSDLGTAVGARARLWAMSELCLGGPLVVALGRSLAAPWWQAMLWVFCVTLLSGTLLVAGPQVSLVGLLLTVLFVLSLGLGGGLGTALPTALGFLLGGALVLLLTLTSSLLDQLWHPAARPQGPPVAPATPVSHARRRDHRALRSPHFRQGLLRATGAAGAAALTWKLGLPFPQWAPITVILCIRPDQVTSMQVAWQNSLGTVLGALLAELYITSIQNPLVAQLILVVVVFLAFTVKDQNYAYFVFFKTNLTLVFVSLAEPGVSRTRLLVISVLVGAVIALAVTFLGARIARCQESRPTTTS